MYICRMDLIACPTNPTHTLLPATKIVTTEPLMNVQHAVCTLIYIVVIKDVLRLRMTYLGHPVL